MIHLLIDSNIKFFHGFTGRTQALLQLVPFHHSLKVLAQPLGFCESIQSRGVFYQQMRWRWVELDQLLNLSNISALLQRLRHKSLSLVCSTLRSCVGILALAYQSSGRRLNQQSGCDGQSSCSSSRLPLAVLGCLRRPVIVHRSPSCRVIRCTRLWSTVKIFIRSIRQTIRRDQLTSRRASCRMRRPNYCFSIG